MRALVRPSQRVARGPCTFLFLRRHRQTGVPFDGWHSWASEVEVAHVRIRRWLNLVGQEFEPIRRGACQGLRRTPCR